MADAPPGWYPDPSGTPGVRYFDGTRWTEWTHSADSGAMARVPLGAAQPAQPAGVVADAATSGLQAVPPPRGDTADADLRPGDALIEFIGGHRVRVARGSSLTIGSDAAADVRVQDPSVGALHLRIDNRVIPPGYDPSHPYCTMVWVADIRAASLGHGPASGTGVVRDVRSDFVMPLEPGEAAPMHNGTIVLFGELQLRLVAGA